MANIINCIGNGLKLLWGKADILSPSLRYLELENRSIGKPNRNGVAAGVCKGH